MVLDDGRASKALDSQKTLDRDMYLSNIHSVISNRVRAETGGDLELAVPISYANT